tara:strand:- start:21 stop:938 length:918 start_codon:yes stop_codon:yes gene_type:complete
MARQLTSLVLLFTPVLVLNALRFIVTPLGDMMAVSLYLDIGLHVGALGVGYFLFRKTRMVRDHEWQRSRAIKSVGNHFKAEDSGVWEKDVAMETQLSPEAQANLSAHVGVAVGGMKTTSETEIETEVEVEMLVDAEHVRKAQARVSGDEQFEDGSVNSTVGAVRKPSPMDRFLDWISSFSGRDRKQEREERKNAKLLARSQQSPVIAQRPIAPLRPVQSEEKRVVPMEMISVTDTGAESVTIDEDTNEISTPIQRSISIEEMAYGTVKSSTRTGISGFAPQPTCKMCSAPNPVGERFCMNCGSEL